MNPPLELDKHAFLAKSHPSQTLADHISDLLVCYDNLMALYGDRFTETERELLRLACIHHDDGKMNDYFQKRMKGHRGWKRLDNELPHGHLSILFLDHFALKEKYDIDWHKALVTAIYHHHTRSDELSQKAYYIAAENSFHNAESLGVDPKTLKRNQRNIAQLLFRNIENHIQYQFPEKLENAYLHYLVLKGLLNRIDYAASAGFTTIEVPAPKGGAALPVQERFGESLLPAQQYLAKHRDESCIIIAPTGSGKTEGAMLWLGEDKGFYTLPLTVSANAIYQRIKGVYRYDNAALLHSDTLSYYIKSITKENQRELDEMFREYRDAKRLAMPLTVCTVDQLFHFVFKSLGTEIYGATLRYSKLIIDEIQMYDGRITAFLLYGLSAIHQMGGKFLIMTATLPPFFLNLLKSQCGIDLTPQTFLEGKYNHRHFISVFEGDFDYEAIATAGKYRKVLFIVNTVQKAQEVYDALNQYCDNHHMLHARFIFKHKKLLEEKIMDFSRNGQCGIWISTQIVEASLDIDFDELFTEGAPLDSLLQRFGRCFRKRNYQGATPNIHIYFNGNGIGTVYDGDITAFTLEALKKQGDGILSEKGKQELMHEVYAMERIKSTAYYQIINDTLEQIKAITPAEIPKSQADHLFRDIHSLNVIPDSIYNKNSEEINDAIETIHDTEASLPRRLAAQEYLKELCVSVAVNQAKQFHLDGFTPEFCRSRCVYDFDIDTCRGKGLTAEKTEDDTIL